MGRIRLFVSITVVALLVGCAGGSAARSPWRVQRVQPWPASPQKPVVPQSAAPNAVSPRPGTAPPVTEKLVPLPTLDPQSKGSQKPTDPLSTHSNRPALAPETTVQPQIRFKPAPLGSSAEGEVIDELQTKPNSGSLNNLDAPALSFPPSNSRDSSTKTPSEESSPPQLRFEALDPPNHSPLKIDVTGQRTRPVGGTVTFDVVVTNDSEKTLEAVVINVDFDRDLVFPGHAEKQLQRNLGQMLPGQSRDMRLTLVSNKLGRHACRFEVVADGLDPVKHVANVAYSEQKLQLQLIGPERRTVGSRAEFTVKVANTSTEVIDDLKVTLNHDSALSPREATGGYQREATALRWTLGRLAPGEGVQVQAEFDCRQLAENACITAEARSEKLSAEEVETCVTVVAVPGLLDLRISDRTDPVKIGEEAEYEVTVQNLGLQSVNEVTLDLQTSEHLKLGAYEAKLGDKSLSLEKSDNKGQLTLVLPGSLSADATLRLIIRAKTLKPGDAELRVIAMPGPNGSSVESSEFTSLNR